MIIDVNGKRIVFGMDWKTRLSEGDVHKEVRAAKSPFLWHGEQSFFYGVLDASDTKEKIKGPLYSGAIALMNRYPEHKNLAMVLEISGQGYIVCAIHQGRPRSGYDQIVTSEVDVNSLLVAFKQVCGMESFKLLGDVSLPGIEQATMDDVVSGLDAVAQLKRVQSAFVSPLVFVLLGTLALFAAWYGFGVYKKYRDAEAQKAALAATKSSKQLYLDELAARRADQVIAARSIGSALAPIRELAFSIGGWRLQKATCDVATTEKQMVCKYDYMRPETGRATYKTFAALSKRFDKVEYKDNLIQTTKTYKDLPFVAQGTVMDGAIPVDETVIEFGSTVQTLRRHGTSKVTEIVPYAVPATANIGELDSIQFGAAKWEFNGPLRLGAAIASFPHYTTLSQIIVDVTDKPVYVSNQSLAMMKLSGTVFSKPSARTLP